MQAGPKEESSELVFKQGKKESYKSQQQADMKVKSSTSQITHI